MLNSLLTEPPAIAKSSSRSISYRPFGAMRLLLALLVMIEHYSLYSYQKTSHILMPFEPANIAVLVFFFLSGFVITEAAELIYLGRPAAFLTNRLLRIVPLFALTILLSFGALYLVSRFAIITDVTGKPSAEPVITARNLAENLLTIIPLPGRISMGGPDFKVLQIAW